MRDGCGRMMLIRRALVLLLLVFPTALCADLSSDIKAILKDKYLTKVDLGISVARVGNTPDATTNVYQFDSDIPLIPASNLKLLTTSAFLDRVGGDFKFRTRLLARDRDVILVGDGDPTLGD